LKIRSAHSRMAASGSVGSGMVDVVFGDWRGAV